MKPVFVVAFLILVASRTFFETAGETSDPLRFVHLSDLHCQIADRNPEGKFPLDPHQKDLVRSYDWLAAAVRDINENVRPDFVVITGDLTNLGSQISHVRKVKDELDKLNCPYYPVVGDHDRKTTYGPVFGEKYSYAFTTNGWRFVALDGYRGGVNVEGLRFLKREIRDHPDDRMVVFMHRPVYMGRLEETLAKRVYGTSLLAKNAGELRTIINPASNIRAVLAGHCHLNLEMVRNGQLHITSGSLIEPPYQYRVLEERDGGLSWGFRYLRLPRATGMNLAAKAEGRERSVREDIVGAKRAIPARGSQE
ncbi:metallophosphoesterase [bacterium]|nr:metallophosphoesterase [bacterium]